MKKSIFFKCIVSCIVFFVFDACIKPGHFKHDSDGDGVIDHHDLCPDTPEGDIVDKEGCTLKKRTYVPDDNFEQHLIDLGHDDVLDDYVTTANIITLEELDLESNFISDLTGLQDFVSLLHLRIDFEPITSLDISPLPRLKELYLRDTDEIESLIISEHMSLESLYIETFNLPKLEITNNAKLANVELRDFNIDATNPLRISGNIELVRLKCVFINAQSAIITDNTQLELFIMEDTHFIDLDLANNDVLSRIWCQACTNVSLDFAAVPSLTELNILSADLTSLNINENTNLQTLLVMAQTLTSFDVSNNVLLETLNAQNNTLTCIKVNQDQLDAIPPGWVKYSGAVYALDCP